MIKKTIAKEEVAKKESKEVKKVPVVKYKSGAIQLTVWNNEQTKEDGEVFENYTFNIERSYKDKEDEWKHTTSFRKRDVANLQALMSKVSEYLYIDEDEEVERIE